MDGLTNAGISCLQAEEDAGRIIVQNAIESSLLYETLVYAEDTDILVILLALLPDSPHDVLFVPHKRKANKKKFKVWSIQITQQRLGETVGSRLLFIHALSGCDTTSRPFNIGKASVVKRVSKERGIGLCADIFVDLESTKDDIIKAGEVAMVLLTGGNKKNSLSDHRYKEFRRRVLKGNKAMDPKYLPPSSG